MNSTIVNIVSSGAMDNVYFLGNTIIPMYAISKFRPFCDKRLTVVLRQTKTVICIQTHEKCGKMRATGTTGYKIWINVNSPVAIVIRRPRNLYHTKKSP